MENVEEQILTYPHRSPDEQRRIESFVEEHPEWAPLLHDVRALERFVGQSEETDSPTDALLATYVVVQHLHPGEVSPAMEKALSDLEARLEDNPSLRERANTMERRLETAEAAIDPVAQFESLTGHSLEPEATEESTAAASVDQDSPLTVLDRLLRLPGAVRWAGAAVAVLLGAYVALYSVSVASQSPLDRLAVPDVSDRVVRSYAGTRTRGATPMPDTTRAQDVYLEALSVLREAHTSTLGLFPTFDSEKVKRAERLLTRVTEQTPPNSFLALEAQFYLGKVNLAQRQVDTARTQLRRVVEQEGRQADEARRILRRLQELDTDATDGR